MTTRNAASPGGVSAYSNVEAPWQAVNPGGSTVTLYADTPVALGELETMVALIEVRKIGAPGIGGTVTLKATVENVAGTLTHTVTGSTTTLYTDISTPASPANLNTALAGCSGAIVASGTGLAVQVTAPGGVPIYARANIDISRGQKPPTVALSISPTSGSGAGGTTVTVTGEGLSAGILAVVLSSPGLAAVTALPTVLSDYSLTFVTPAMPTGVYDVDLVRADANYVLSGAFTATAATAPTLASIDNPIAIPGTTVHVATGTNLGGVTGVTVNGVAATGVSSTSTTVTFTMPTFAANGSGTAQTVAVTTPSGTASAALLYVVPTNLTVAAMWIAHKGFTPGSGGAWLDQMHGYSAAPCTGMQVSQTWANGQPAIAINPGGTAGAGAIVAAGTFTQAQAFSTVWVGDLTSTANSGASTWASLHAYGAGALVVPTSANGNWYRANNTGTSSGSQPTWPTTIGSTVVDGGVTWECFGTTSNQTGVFFDSDNSGNNASLYGNNNGAGSASEYAYGSITPNANSPLMDVPQEWTLNMNGASSQLYFASGGSTTLVLAGTGGTASLTGICIGNTLRAGNVQHIGHTGWLLFYAGGTLSSGDRQTCRTIANAVWGTP